MRNHIKILLREGLLNESMNVYVDGHDSDDNLENVMSIGHFALSKLHSDFFPSGNYPQEVRQMVSYTEITPDGGEAFDETGTINFYLGELNDEIAKKILSYIYYIVPEQGITLGKPIWEKHTNSEDIENSEYRVIRIPIVENNWDEGDRPIEINLSNNNAIFMFRDVLGFELEDYTFEFSIAELSMKLKGIDAKVDSMNLKGGTEQTGNVYKQLPDKEYVMGKLALIEELALWANKRGYTTLSVG